MAEIIVAVAVLPGNLYTKHKNRIKALRETYGIHFNRGAYLEARIYIWEGGASKIRGEYVKDSDGMTIKTSLLLVEDEPTDFRTELKALIEEIGGEWLSHQEWKNQQTNGIEGFDKKHIHNIFGEELEARHRGHEHYLLLKPMISHYLKIREEQFNIADLTVKDVMTKLGKMVYEAERRN